MHYYKRNIGDYHKRAGRLSMIEHGAYTLLLDACCDRERCPQDEAEACAWCLARTDAEREAVHSVLALMFERAADGYTNDFLAAELSGYAAKRAINSGIAKARETTKRARMSTVRDEPCTNEHEPCTNEHLTKNQEPRTKNQEPKEDNPSASRVPPTASPLVSVKKIIEAGVDPQHAADWLAVRAKKKMPITGTAWEAVQREAKKAGMSLDAAVKKSAEMSWGGFSAAWLDDKSHQPRALASFAEQARARMDALTGGSKQKNERFMGEVFDAAKKLG